jgi:hypothetical protein
MASAEHLGEREPHGWGHTSSSEPGSQGLNRPADCLFDSTPLDGEKMGLTGPAVRATEPGNRGEPESLVAEHGDEGALAASDDRQNADIPCYCGQPVYVPLLSFLAADVPMATRANPTRAVGTARIEVSTRCKMPAKAGGKIGGLIQLDP